MQTSEPTRAMRVVPPPPGAVDRASDDDPGGSMVVLILGVAVCAGLSGGAIGFVLGLILA